MELNLLPVEKNIHPLKAFFIKGENPMLWVKEIERMELSLSSLKVYALPGLTPDSVWGCLVEGKLPARDLLGKNVPAQSIESILYIPEKTQVFPPLQSGEIGLLLKNKIHAFHPQFGLVELEEALNWRLLLQVPLVDELNISIPSATTFIPDRIKSYQVKTASPEESLQSLEKNFPKQQKFPDKPLNFTEKIKLHFYKWLLGNKEEERGGINEIKKGFLKRLSEKRKAAMELTLEELEKRNKKVVDRLLEMLKKDPERALKYAMPLDNDGVSRGGAAGVFNLEKLWSNFSLFGSYSDRGGGAAISAIAMARLQTQYTQTAQELINKGDYRKAAFIHLKLLRNPFSAAEALVKGELYSEAAAVYLKHCNNKFKAAECYENGNMIDEAIKLYKELGIDEKVGDLYVKKGEQSTAIVYYNKVVDDYKQNNHFISASFIYKIKLNDLPAAQQTLMEGWNSNKDSFNCIQLYLANIENEKDRWKVISNLYQKDIKEEKYNEFLQVLKSQIEKDPIFTKEAEDLAYEIISKQILTDPSAVNSLPSFNKKDKQLKKDIIRFKVGVGGAK